MLKMKNSKTNERTTFGGVSMDETLKQKAEESYRTNIVDKNILDRNTASVYIRGYLAGATENDIQWHDLRKNPNDLPKKNKSYWVYIDCQGNKIYRSIVWQGCWLGWNCIPLAWCEEPQFKE